MAKKSLNVNISKAISDFQAVAKELELKNKIYKIIFRGKGLEFDRYRDFSPDDNAIDIDWKASMRANRILVKQYIEERDLDFIFFIDVSENMILGSTEKLKCEYVVEMVAALAYLINSANDRFGVVLFNDKIVDFIPSKGGRDHFYMIMDLLSNPEIYGGSSKIEIAVRFALDYLSREIEAVIFISDFLRMNDSILKELTYVSNKFETFALMIKDPLDIRLPDIDREIVIEDPSSGQKILINPKKAGKMYERYSLEKEKIVRKTFLKSGIDLLRLTTDKKFSYPLAEFLQERVLSKGSVISS